LSVANLRTALVLGCHQVKPTDCLSSATLPAKAAQSRPHGCDKDSIAERQAIPAVEVEHAERRRVTGPHVRDVNRAAQQELGGVNAGGNGGVDGGVNRGVRRPRKRTAARHGEGGDECGERTEWGAAEL